jgi:malate/lactate dehydrogenase
MSVPLVLSIGGIDEIIEMTTAPDEQPLLSNSINILQTAMKQVEDFLEASE